MIISKFEDIPVWQESRIFLKKIHNLINNNRKLKCDYAISDQLRRAAYSINLNIAEGFERGSNTEFANFLNIAKGSAGEVRAILYLIEDNAYVVGEGLVKLRSEVQIISTHIANFREFLLINKTRKK